mmetsp:Transcript_53091/g.170065  ORF Transcript_53091/g.170065 Transcript_53091/m.170065 type:complete len:122 (-) Transcript_53091:86-451(-)
MPRGPSEQDLQDALKAYKEEKERAKGLGDYNGEAEAALAMAQIHVMAGKREDARRAQAFMPPSKMHPAAAGANAKTALDIFTALGSDYQEQMNAAQMILDMERVQAMAAYRHHPFNYDYAI